LPVVRPECCQQAFDGGVFTLDDLNEGIPDKQKCAGNAPAFVVVDMSISWIRKTASKRHVMRSGRFVDIAFCDVGILSGMGIFKLGYPQRSPFSKSKMT
jgi:hypothetical protein